MSCSNYFVRVGSVVEIELVVRVTGRELSDVCFRSLLLELIFFSELVYNSL